MSRATQEDMKMALVTMRETKTAVVDWTELALAVERRVMAKLQRDLANWEDDLSMREMFIADAADGMAVCVLLEQGKWREAESKIWHMDTAARDYVWEFIEAELGVDELEFIRQQNG
jgi:hypothetical protein